MLAIPWREIKWGAVTENVGVGKGRPACPEKVSVRELESTSPVQLWGDSQLGGNSEHKGQGRAGSSRSSQEATASAAAEGRHVLVGRGEVRQVEEEQIT